MRGSLVAFALAVAVGCSRFGATSEAAPDAGATRAAADAAPTDANAVAVATDGSTVVPGFSCAAHHDDLFCDDFAGTGPKDWSTSWVVMNDDAATMETVAAPNGAPGRALHVVLPSKPDASLHASLLYLLPTDPVASAPSATITLRYRVLVLPETIGYARIGIIAHATRTAYQPFGLALYGSGAASNLNSDTDPVSPGGASFDDKWHDVVATLAPTGDSYKRTLTIDKLTIKTDDDVYLPGSTNIALGLFDTGTAGGTAEIYVQQVELTVQ